MTPKWQRLLEAMKNLAFTFPKHLQTLVCRLNGYFYVEDCCVCVCVIVNILFFLCTHAGHQGVVNFRPSKRTANKSISYVMNVQLEVSISV